MSKMNKKEIKVPNFKKTISDFMKNESWSISTKSAITIWVMWVAAAWASWLVDAACNISWGHFNGVWNGHYSWSWTFWASVINVPNDSCSGTDVNYNYNNWCTTLVCSPINWLVNWHYNINPSCSSNVISKHCNHVSSGDSWDSGDGWDSCG